MREPVRRDQSEFCVLVYGFCSVVFAKTGAKNMFRVLLKTTSGGSPENGSRWESAWNVAVLLVGRVRGGSAVCARFLTRCKAALLTSQTCIRLVAVHSLGRAGAP